MTENEAMGITTPLLTNNKGEKLGKSENNSVSLNPEVTSPYDLYQYIYNIPDIQVPSLLRQLTFLPIDQIEEVINIYYI